MMIREEDVKPDFRDPLPGVEWLSYAKDKGHGHPKKLTVVGETVEFTRKFITMDGSCFFRALCLAYFHNDSDFMTMKLRFEVGEALKEYRIAYDQIEREDVLQGESNMGMPFLIRVNDGNSSQLQLDIRKVVNLEVASDRPGLIAHCVTASAEIPVERTTIFARSPFNICALDKLGDAACQPSSAAHRSPCSILSTTFDAR